MALVDRVAIPLANSLRIRLRLDVFDSGHMTKKPHYLRVAQSIPVIQTVFPQLFWCECFLQDVLIHVQLLLLPPASCTVHVQCFNLCLPNCIGVSAVSKLPYLMFSYVSNLSLKFEINSKRSIIVPWQPLEPMPLPRPQRVLPLCLPSCVLGFSWRML